MKKIFVITSVILFTIFISMGCFQRAPFEQTKKLWDKSKERKDVSYTDTIISFYINKNGEEIIFLGERYHYVFTQNTEEFSQILASKDFLELEKGYFNIHANIDNLDNRIINTSIRINIPNNKMNQKQRKWVTDNKFIPKDKNNYYYDPYTRVVNTPSDTKTLYFRSFQLQGKRYYSSKEVNEKAIKLKQVIKLNIKSFEYKDKNKIGQIVMTPISIVSDIGADILVIGANLMLTPLYLIMILSD